MEQPDGPELLAKGSDLQMYRYHIFYLVESLDASRWQESIRSASKKTVAEAECSQLPHSALLVQKDHVVVRGAHGIA